MKTIKVNFESDTGDSNDYEFEDNDKGMRALGEMIFAALEGHAAYIMITPNDIEELINEADNG